MLKVYLLYRDARDFILATETRPQAQKLVIKVHSLMASALPFSFFTGKIEWTPLLLPYPTFTFVGAQQPLGTWLSLLHLCSSCNLLFSCMTLTPYPQVIGYS